MKSFFLSLLFVSSAFFSFAGKGVTVQQRYVSPGSDAKITVTWYIQDGKAKMKMDFGDSKVNTSTFFLPDYTNKQLLTYSDGPVPSDVQKAYFAVPLSKLELSKQMDVNRIKIERTGEMKEIGGFKCEKLIMTTNKTITEMWVTKDIKAEFYQNYPFFLNSFELLGLSEEKIKGIPMSSVTKDLSGRVINGYDFVSASTTELSDEDFKVPAGFVEAK